MSTIRDVAKLSGVSVTTVSIILNGQAESRKISQQTQEKVQAAMKKLNYQPNISVRKMKDTGYTIGVYWADDFRNYYLARLINGLQTQIIRSNLNLSIIIRPYKNGTLMNDPMLKVVGAYNCAIIANTSAEDDAFLESSDFPIPIILYNRTSEKYHTVSIDNERVGRQAALHFIGKGLTSIGMFISETPYPAMNIRNSSFRRTCEEHAIAISSELVVCAPNRAEASAGAASHFLDSKTPPRAIYCENDTIARGLLFVLHEHGIRVPEDVEVLAVGVGSSDIHQFTIPSMTVVELPLEKLAGECVLLIEKLLNYKVDTPQHLVFEAPLIVRQSSPQ